MTLDKSMPNAPLLTRLRRVEGQIRGIQRMIEDERPCEEVITQLSAARAALDQAGVLVLSRYVEDCFGSAGADQSTERLHRIIELLFKFK